MDALAVKQACMFAKEHALKNGPLVSKCSTSPLNFPILSSLNDHQFICKWIFSIPNSVRNAEILLNSKYYDWLFSCY